jgi:flavin reductase (DIM6/NTAB) family NADH-FMN oxidoreductase RutF
LTLKNKIKKIVTGLTVPQEYICVEWKDFICPPSIFLELENQKFLQDVTDSHLFLGYKPLVLGLSFNTNDTNYSIVRNQERVFLSFKQGSAKVSDTTSIAKLILKKIGEKKVGDETVLLYEGEYGSHSFLSAIHQWINTQREKRRKHSPDNVSLPGNLADQVRIAYSTPRIISIITTSDGHLVNLFPTDLHGSVGKKFYASSLRKGGKANDQVERYGQIVISEVETSFYKQAYALGKNHMKELQDESGFQIHSSRSKNFNFPLPSSATHYRELKRIDSFDHGIHRIHFYEVIHQQVVSTNKSTLSHIHQYYTQWRIDHGLQAKIFLR